MVRFHSLCRASRCWFGLFLSLVQVQVHAQVDSSALYQRIHDYSQKRKVTRWIYEGIFVAPEYDKEPPAPKGP